MQHSLKGQSLQTHEAGHHREEEEEEVGFWELGVEFLIMGSQGRFFCSCVRCGQKAAEDVTCCAFSVHRQTCRR